jgi:putative DNA primase/helicase
MADITNIFGGEFVYVPPTDKPFVEAPEVQLQDAMRREGLDPPKTIHFDGKLHRFNTGKRQDLSAWYVAFGDGIPAGRFGDWRSGTEKTWRATMERSFTPAEEMAFTRRMSEAKATRDAELERTRETASTVVDKIWSDGMAASPDHPYLARKGIGVNCARVTGDGRLMVPLYSPDGTISSLQYISDDGEKKYHPGGATGGKFWSVGTDDSTIYIAEGFATAATIHEETGNLCIVAFSASNLVPALAAMREIHGKTKPIIIVADNDASGVGQRYAEQAAAKYGARIVVPPIEGDANDFRQAGKDLKGLLQPIHDDWLIPADDFCSQPQPIRWLVKKWVQQDAMIMVHGPSGGGKTFVVMDWCLHMASAQPQWAGNRVKGGRVVYLAGEGHHGLKSRTAAWKQHHGVKRLDMYISRAGCDLNSPEGYRIASEAIRLLDGPPDLIVVDTLHRFLRGDENSAQDAKTMLDACAALMGEFGCSVLLVHHTGVSEESQHRARGSSAWKGALEIEISIVPAKDGAPLEIHQRKAKDSEQAEPVYADLEQVQIFGWLDEDGEPVTSAVVKIVDAPARADKKDSPIQRHMKTFDAAWFASGCDEMHDENGELRPFITKVALKRKLKSDNPDKADRTIDNYVDATYQDKLIGALLLGGIIKVSGAGWVVMDDVLASSMLMRKKSP